MKVRFILVTILGAAVSAAGATFVVRTDRDLIRRSEAIVVGTPLTSYTTESGNAIETVTVLSVEEVIKGAVLDRTINIVEPGGVYGNRATGIPGVPRFETGSRVLLFLMKTGPSRWAVFDLVVGKFEFAEDQIGEKVLIRDEADIVGWDPDLTPHRELRRSADRFLRFVRTEARNGLGQTNYNVRTYSLRSTSASRSLQPAPLAAFSATSYTFSFDGTPTGTGGRWNVFPSAVTFFQISTEPGAPGTPAGATAIQTGMNSWNGDCPSNVNYVYGGLDSNQGRTGGVNFFDGVNDVYYEQDLSAIGPPFNCGSGGLLGVGGVTHASGSNSFNGETFFTIVEGDVQMNKGIANCTSLFTSGDFNTAVTHELGHTLGFRHADQTRQDQMAIPCSTDPSLECSSLAVMKAVVPNGINAALQTWDQHAVEALYAATCGTPKKVRLDFDNDGKSDFTVFRPPTGAWYVLKSAGGSTGTTWGTNGDIPVPGDYDGDGIPDFAVFRPSTGAWYVQKSTGGSMGTVWGTNGDIPVVGDYDGDGKADFAIFRPSTGTWYIQLSGGGTQGFQWGTNGDQPAAGDFDGDGKADPTIFRPSQGAWYVRKSTGGTTGTLWGTAGDIAVVGDYDGDGKADYGIFRPSSGTWYVQYTAGGTFGTQWGTNGDQPVSGDYDGDGKTDFTVFRPATGTWYVKKSSGGTQGAQWGTATDIPLLK